MASNIQATGGYDYQFVEDPPDSLKCVICLLVVRDPQQHGNCGRLFCDSCISEYTGRGNDTCPYCRKLLNMFSDKRSALDVKSLKVQCENDDCPWQGELRSIEEHVEKCEYTIVLCPNKCGTKILRKKNLDDHLELECIKREYKCPYCEKKGQYDKITTAHLEECPEFEIECPNEGCKEKVPRCKVSTHQTTCAYEPVFCKYAEIGCEEKPLRKDLKVHEEDIQLHFCMAADKILELNAEIEQNKKRFELSLNKKIGGVLYFNTELETLLQKKHAKEPIQFRHQNFQEKETAFSPPFYTSFTGYKMCLKVYANGNGDGKGTHVSVFTCLMKGDNDDSLTWPFTGTVTIELLNQLEDRNHYLQTITFTANIGKRVVDGERGSGWGNSRFIPHTHV